MILIHERTSPRVRRGLAHLQQAISTLKANCSEIMDITGPIIAQSGRVVEIGKLA